jgi:hypothetical protein
MERIQVPPGNCPTAPPPRVTVYTRVLHRACQKLGGVQELANELRVSLELLHRWLEGEDVPPAKIFLKAVDLVTPPWTPEDAAHAKAVSDSRPKKN